MKKLISIPVISLLFVSWATAQIQENDSTKVNLRGKVKSITTKQKSREVAPSSSTIIFNKDGNPIEMDFDNSKGKIIYKYDQNGNTIEEKGNRPDGSVWYQYASKYDDSGYMVETNSTREMFNEMFKEKIIYKYDGNGHLIEQLIWFNPDRSDSYKKTFTYNDKGHLIEKDYYDPKGKLLHKYTYKYDEQGHVIESNKHKPNGGLSGRYTYKYDEHGHVIEENEYKSNGGLSSKDTYKYDEHGALIEQNSYAPNGSLKNKTTNKYDYDKNLNWVKKVEFKNGTAALSTERVIEYSQPDTAKNVPLPQRDREAEIAKTLVEQKQFIVIPPGNQSVKYSIGKDTKPFALSTGESRVGLLKLPDYAQPYTLTISSLPEWGGLKASIFVPSGVFLDSAFQSTGELLETAFKLLNPGSAKFLHLETDISIDENRKGDQYLLIYTLGEYIGWVGYMYFSVDILRAPGGDLSLEVSAAK